MPYSNYLVDGEQLSNHYSIDIDVVEFALAVEAVDSHSLMYYNRNRYLNKYALIRVADLDVVQEQAAVVDCCSVCLLDFAVAVEKLTLDERQMLKYFASMDVD